MISNLKRLGLTLLATGMLGGMAAPAVQATPEFTAFDPSTNEHPSEASLHAELIEKAHEFTAGAVVAKCSTATFTGTITKPSTTLTLAPTYSSCTASGATTHVEMKGCEYLYHLQTQTAETEYTGTVDLLCPGSEGPTLTVTGSGGSNKCVFHIEPDQEGLGTVDFREAGGKMEIQMTVTEIDYISTGKLLECGVTEGTHSNGKYEGIVKTTAKVGESAVSFQAVPSDLVSSPAVLKIKKDVKNEGTITLTTKGKNKMKIAGVSTSVAFKAKKDNCSGQEVPCTVEIECLQKGVQVAFTSTGLDQATNLYHAAVTKVECE